jgi:hypothetical protein
MRKFVAIASVLLLLPLLGGCGNRGTSGPILKGVVLKDGTPYPVKSLGGEFSLSFVVVQPDGKPGAVFLAEAPDPVTGQFEVTGPTGQGIPAGKYKIQAKHVIVGKKSPLAENLSTDATPLEVTITDSPDSLKIDLGNNPSVTGK